MSQLNQTTNDGQLDYRDNLEAYYEAAWIFNQDEYSRESFTAEFNEILTERVGKNWREHKVNTPIKEKALLVVYEAWIQGLDQLHLNELLAEGEELLEDESDDGWWQVEVIAYLEPDNKVAFSIEELLFKLQNLMANKELGDHVFFEGFDYVGLYNKETGVKDEENGLTTLYVCCGS
mgnify:FL=1